VPRPPVQLVRPDNSLDNSLDTIEVRGRDDPSIDITQDINEYCQVRAPELDNIHGYIFKSRSPSCGIKDIPLFNNQGEANETTMGVFAHAVLQHYPDLPITDEQGLLNSHQCEHFLYQVKQFQQKRSC